MTIPSQRFIPAIGTLALMLLVPALSQATEAEASASEPAAPPRLEPPRLTAFVEASYPEGVPAEAGPVEVELDLLIDADGSVSSATPVAETGTPFETAAVAAARQFVFEPAKRDGKAIPARIRYRYVFAPPPPPPPTTGVLEGRVLSRADEPVANATVTVFATDGTVAAMLTTPADGTFRAGDLAAGSYRIDIGALGLRPYSSIEDVAAGQATTLTVRLDPVAPKASEGEPLEFGATATVEAPPREVTKRSLGTEELVKVAGTRGDALRAIEYLPGVARPPAGMGFVIVRGSGPMDSEVELEGAPVYRLYHFGGLTSFVQGRMLDRIDLYPGNFSARYGRKTGGIIDVTLRDPKTDRFHGLVDVNVIDAAAMAEGPITKTLSAAAAFRRSYIDAWFGALANSTDLAVTAAPVYYDYQLLLTWRPSETDRVRTFVYGSTDGLKLVLKRPLDGDSAIRGKLKSETGFHRVQAQWLHKYGERAEHEISMTVGPLTEVEALGESLGLDLKILEVYGRAEWRVRLGNRLRLLAGIDSQIVYGDIVFRGPRMPAMEGDPSAYGPLAGRETTDLVYQAWFARPAAYAELAFRPIDAWQIVGGVRADYYQEIHTGSVDPRLVTRYELGTGTTIKAGAGLFSQPPEIPQSLRTIGNPDLRPAHGQHYSAGAEQKLGFALASLEGFYKRLDNLVVASVDPAVPLQDGGIGRIWGLEASLRTRVGSRGFGFISYTYSRSRRNDHGIYWRRFDFDQPHILTMSGSYRVGAGFELGSTFRYVSGNPYTPVVGSQYDASYDLYRPVYGQVNSARNPAFHQLDVRVEKVWQRGWGNIALYLDVQNAYNRANPEGRYYKYDYSQSRTLPGLPIIPSLGLRGEL